MVCVFWGGKTGFTCLPTQKAEYSFSGFVRTNKTKTAGKWQKCNLVSEHGLCGQRHGLAMNWVDRPRTRADEQDVVWAPRCRDCVWAVAGFGCFFIDFSFLREQSP